MISCIKNIFYILIIVCLNRIDGFSQPTFQWDRTEIGDNIGAPINVGMSNRDIVYYGSVNKIYKSTDRGETFSIIGTDVPNANYIKCITLLDKNPGTFLVATESSPDQIYKTTDDGQTWTLSMDNASFAFFGNPIVQDPSHPDTVYTMNYVHFLRSTDFGDNWTTIASNIGTNGAPCDLGVFKDTSVIILGDQGSGIFKSTDYGVNWTNVFPIEDGEIPAIAIDFTNPGVAWAVQYSDGGGFYKSTDYGETWSAVPGFDGINMWGVHIPFDDGSIITSACFSCNTTYRSVDSGATWTEIFINSANRQIFVVDSITQFAAQSDGFYKLTRDPPFPVELTSFTARVENGVVILDWETASELNNFGFNVERSFQSETWITLGFAQGNGNSNSPKYYSYKDDNIVLAGTYSYRLKQTDIDGSYEYSSIIQIDIAAPITYELKQNYPNPFNPNTSIEFSIPVDSDVKLILFNMLGQEVATITNSTFNAGVHKIDIDASNLSSGTYLYFIRVKGINSTTYSDTKKLVLIK